MITQRAWLWCAVGTAAMAALQCPGLAKVPNEDVAQTLSGLLKSVGPQPVTTTSTKTVTIRRCHHPSGGNQGGTSGDDICHDAQEIQTSSTTQNQLLTASNLSITSTAPVDIGKLTITALPERFDASAVETTNCASVSEQSGFQIAATTSKATTVQVTHSIANTIGGSVASKVSIVQGWDATVQFNLSSTDTTATATSQQDTSSTTHTESVTLTVPPRTTLVAQMAVLPVQYALPIVAHVSVDGDVSPNNNGWRRLSAIPALQGKLGFEIDGTIVATDATKTHVVINTVPFNPKLCSVGASRVIKRPAQVRSGVKYFAVPSPILKTSK